MSLDAGESLTPDALSALADDRLSSLVAHARAHSPFWAQRLAGLEVTSRADLARLPVLDKDTLAAASPPHATDALTGPLAGATVFRSGGSTGEPKFALYAAEEIAAFVPYFQRTYGAAGLAPGDRVANLFAAGSLYASFVFINRLLESAGVLNMPFTTSAAPDVVARHVKLFDINVLVGFPSWILQVAEAIAAEGLRIEKIFYAGEHLYEEERRYLRERLGATVIASAGYAAVDAGMMAYQCEHSTGGVHHVHADHVALELLHPETGAPVGPGESGLVTVTNLERRLHPVIRYQVGDLGRWVEGDCPCGRTTPRFELLHRGDDVLRIGYASVTYDEVVQAFTAVPELSATVQMVKEREARRDRLALRIELREAVPAAGLAERLGEAVRAVKPDLAKMEASGYIHPLRFEFLPTGGIPRLPVSGKFKRTLDLSGG